MVCEHILQSAWKSLKVLGEKISYLNIYSVGGSNVAEMCICGR